MPKTMMIILCAACILLPNTAFAKIYRLNDNSGNNSCKFVHDWFLNVRHRHAVYVTTGGTSYGVPILKGGICQAGGGNDVKEAEKWAISKCESFSRKKGNHTHCKMVESR